MPLLEGLDGVEKMSKSKGNYVGINESPDEMFGKLMSISDELMWRYYELLSFRPMDEIVALQRECDAGRNPRDAKVALAQEIVARFHSPRGRRGARSRPSRRARAARCGTSMPEVTIETGGAGIPIAHLAKQAGVVESTSEALRLIAGAASSSTARSSPTRR